MHRYRKMFIQLNSIFNWRIMLIEIQHIICLKFLKSLYWISRFLRMRSTSLSISSWLTKTLELLEELLGLLAWGQGMESIDPGLIWLGDGTERGRIGISDLLLVVAMEDFGLCFEVDLGFSESVLLGGLGGLFLVFWIPLDCWLDRAWGRGLGVRVGTGLGVWVGWGLWDSIFQ